MYKTMFDLNDNLLIRNAKLEEMDFILDLAAKEGWNPGLSDGKVFYLTDPKGFFIGEVKGEKIGCISLVAYNELFGFLGFYIVKPKYRGMGLGIKLWNHAIAYAQQRSIGLDGVVEQQENYKKSGFKLYYQNTRFEGRGGGARSQKLIPLNDLPNEQILNYDSSVFGLNREKFLNLWLAMPQTFGFGFLEQGELRGYGFIRPCRNGYKIGPLFADHLEAAETIYQGLCASVKADTPIFWDIPELNSKALSLARKNQWRSVFTTARMYRGKPPSQNLNCVYGVTTFELG